MGLPSAVCRQQSLASAVRLHAPGSLGWDRVFPRRFAASGQGFAAPMRMRVRAEGVDFGRLAGGILARARSGLTTEVDAVGDVAVSNAVKALALANAFADKEHEAVGSRFCVVFTPQMQEESGSRRSADDVEVGGAGKKLMRLVAWPQARDVVPVGDSGRSPKDRANDVEEDFSHGGIYVASSSSAAGSDSKSTGAAVGGSDNGTKPADASTKRHQRSDGTFTPTQLSKTIMGHWQRYAAPDLRAATRTAAAAKGAHRDRNAATASSTGAAGRKRAPFLVTMGPSAVSRAVKGLAFVCKDLQKDHLAGTPSLAILPRLRERRSADRFSGTEKISRLTVLCLVRAAPSA